MRKYWCFFLQTINDFLIYRARLVFISFFQFVTPLTMIWVFSSVSGNQFAGMNRQQITSYYIFISLLGLFLVSRADDFVKISIQHGDFGKYLLKPVRFWVISLINDVSRRSIKLLIGVPIFLIIAFFNGVNIGFSGDLLRFLVIIILSFVLTFLFSYSFRLLTFWLEELWGWQNLRNVSITLLSGMVLPYQFFPKAMVGVLTWTPFPYLVSWPITVGFTNNIYLEISICSLWIFIFLISGMFLWKRGLKIYSALGIY